jgi:hypothetical protein
MYSFTFFLVYPSADRILACDGITTRQDIVLGPILERKSRIPMARAVKNLRIIRLSFFQIGFVLAGL